MTDKMYRRKHRNRAILALREAYPEMDRQSAERWIDVVRDYDDAGKTKEYALRITWSYETASRAWDVYQQTKNKLAAILV